MGLKKGTTTIIIIFFSLLYEKSKSQKSAYCTVVTCWIYLQNVAKKQQVSHEAALTALRTVTGDRCDTPTLEALLSRHGGDAGLAAAAFYEDPRLEPGAARHISE